MSKRTVCFLASVLVLPPAAASAAVVLVDDLTEAVDVAPGHGVCASARGTTHAGCPAVALSRKPAARG